jgi:catechol 2,3-dioxygenase-like lactoylglutathione lyase family enzyme
MQLGQTLLVVSKFRECVEFYRDAMGFKIVRGDAAGPLAVFQSGTQSIGVFDERKMPEAVLPKLGNSGPTRSVVIVVRAASVDEAFQRLSKMGVRYLVEPKDFPDWGVRSSVCQDPEGHLIEIVEDKGLTTA